MQSYLRIILPLDKDTDRATMNDVVTRGIVIGSEHFRSEMQFRVDRFHLLET